MTTSTSSGVDVDLTAFRQAVRQLLDDHAPPSAVRQAMDKDTYDAALWRRLSTDLGVAGLPIPTELGGSGAGQRELGAVMHELGRSLAPSPTLSSVGLATNLLLQVRDTYVDGLLSELAAGSITAALGLPPAGAAPIVTGMRSGSNVLVSGRLDHVVDAQHADVVLVPTAIDGVPALVAVTPGTPGLVIAPTPAMDLTRSLATVELAGAPARLVASGRSVTEALRTTRQLALALLAAECAGIVERSRERSVEHAATRIQFGRPIGSFQAVKHKCARMLVQESLAKALVDEALRVADEDPARLTLHATAAFVSAAEAACRVTGDTIQVHGGIGFTWEDASHLYFKRAWADRVLLGPIGDARRTVAEELGL
jgi:alkylation response protein AidB-like acyl-CoA dehydrogenase